MSINTFKNSQFNRDRQVFAYIAMVLQLFTFINTACTFKTF